MSIAFAPRRSEWLLFATVVAVRFAFAANRKVFSLFPDEPANLAMARWISGTGTWDMFRSSTWRPGYPTLIAPVFWLTDDPLWIERLVLLVGAVFGGIAAIQCGRLTVRLTDLGPRTALVVAGAVALAPAGLAASAHVWAEPLVTVTFLGSLAALLHYFDRPSTRGALIAVTWSVSGFFVHSRLLPLTAVVCAAIVGNLAIRRNVRASLLVTAWAAGLSAASIWYADRIFSALWTDPSNINTISGVAAQLKDPIGIWVSVLGQAWYLQVSTLGVFGIGAAVLVQRSTADSEPVRRRDATLVMLVTAPLLALSMVFLAGRERGDQLVYGRYNDAVVWPVIVIGLAWLIRLAHQSIRSVPRADKVMIGTTITSIGLLGAITALVVRDRGFVRLGVVEMVTGLTPLGATNERLPVLSASLVAMFAAGVLIVILLADRIPTWVVGALAMSVLGFAAARTHQALSVDLNAGADSAAVADLEQSLLPPGSSVVYGFVPELFDPGVNLYTQGYYAQLYQWYLPDTEFRVTSSGDYPEGELVFAPVFDRVLVDRGATQLWVDPAVGIALWRA